MFFKTLLSKVSNKTLLLSSTVGATSGFITLKKTDEKQTDDNDQLSKMMLFTGQSHPQFAKSVADKIGIKMSRMTPETFSNSEHSLQIKESVHGKDVYIVQTGRGGPQGDSELMEVLTMIHTAKINSAKSVTVVLPNYPFARSDKVDKPRTPIMARLVADLLTTAGADHLVTMDLHAGQIQGFFSIPVDNIFASPAIYDWYDFLQIVRYDNDYFQD